MRGQHEGRNPRGASRWIGRRRRRRNGNEPPFRMSTGQQVEELAGMAVQVSGRGPAYLPMSHLYAQRTDSKLDPSLVQSDA